MSERGLVVWFSYVVSNMDEVCEEATVDLPDAFSFFTAGTTFTATASEWRYGVRLITATVRVEVEVDLGLPTYGRVVRLQMYDLPLRAQTQSNQATPWSGECSAVEIETAAKELASALALVPHMELLAKKALAWAQAHASKAPTEE